MTFQASLEDVNLGLTYAAQTFTILFDGVASADCYFTSFLPWTPVFNPAFFN